MISAERIYEQSRRKIKSLSNIWFAKWKNSQVLAVLNRYLRAHPDRIENRFSLLQPAPLDSRAESHSSIPKQITASVTQSPAIRDPEAALAVVGIDCRFPGADDWRSFWTRLCEQYDGISTMPAERRDSFFPFLEGSGSHGWMTRGGFIADPFTFDHSFFSISPRESELMDPHQRLLLQSVWNAVEDAGYAMSDFSKRFRVGTFVGMSSMDFAWYAGSRALPAAPQNLTGGSHSITANRLAFVFDFHGPSETVDTACSSALVALHRARQAIEAGECDVAVVAASNLLLSPIIHASFGQAGMLSEEGLCRTFDSSASGYVRSEGVAAVVVKSLRQALADGDNVYGLIRARYLAQFLPPHEFDRTQADFEAALPTIEKGSVASHEYTEDDAKAAIKANMK